MARKSRVWRICLGVGAGGSSSGEASSALRTWSLMKSAACPRRNASEALVRRTELLPLPRARECLTLGGIQR
jgi:hypothetical protein